MRVATFAVGLAVAATGCRQLLGLETPGVTADSGADTMADSNVVDASACVAASVECASASTLRMCTDTGAMAIDTVCAWGCITGNTAHCGQLVPSGGGVSVPNLVDTTGLADVDLTGTLNGDSGAIAGSITRAPGTGVTAGIDYALSNNIAIFRFKSLHVTGPLKLGGSHPIALVADGAIIIDDVLDARGPACGSSTSDLVGGPGGFTGGQNGMSGSGSGAGAFGPDQISGGGGGGYGGIGGSGGHDVGSGPAGGPTFGNLAIDALVGGGGGGGGHSGNQGRGGGGGGAVQLASNTQITFGVMGGVNAGGCGGGRSTGCGSCTSGGGGGGGAILLEAPQLTIDGTLAVNGGGGGGQGGDGATGTFDRIPALGGVIGNGGPGGVGGAATQLDGAPGPTSAVRPGGGGGAVGRIRANTRTGVVIVHGTAVLSPSFSDVPTSATAGTANVQ